MLKRRMDRQYLPSRASSVSHLPQMEVDTQSQSQQSWARRPRGATATNKLRTLIGFGLIGIYFNVNGMEGKVSLLTDTHSPRQHDTPAYYLPVRVPNYPFPTIARGYCPNPPGPRRKATLPTSRSQGAILRPRVRPFYTMGPRRFCDIRLPSKRHSDVARFDSNASLGSICHR